MAFIDGATTSTGAAFGGVVLLQTVQRLGDFPPLDAIPLRLIHHLAAVMGVLLLHDILQHYEPRRVRKWHLPLMRDHLGITAFSDGGRRVLVGAGLEASRSKDLLADLLNVGIAALVHARDELPACSTLRRAAQKARAQVNHRYDQYVHGALDDVQRATLKRLFHRDDTAPPSLGQRLTRAPQPPTIKHIREHRAHVRWLQSLNPARQARDGIPEANLQCFADEARALPISRRHEPQEANRVALAVALIRVRPAQALDDLPDMLIRRRQKPPPPGNEARAAYRRQHPEQPEALMAVRGHIVTGGPDSETPEHRLTMLDTLLGEEAEASREPGDVHRGYAGNNSWPFLLPLFRNPRQLGVDRIECLHPVSTSTASALEHAMAFVVRHRHARGERLPVPGSDHSPAGTLEVSWGPPRWWKAVPGRHRRDGPIFSVDRKDLELWVWSCARGELTSGDLCMAGRERFSDDREPWVTWEDDTPQGETYCQQVGIAADASHWLHDLQTPLPAAIRTTDAAFPPNPSLTMTAGEPVLRRRKKLPDPDGLALTDRRLSPRLPACTIVDLLPDTAHGLTGTAAFGPLSGVESRLGSPRHRDVTTTFCYGCYLGPSQTSPSITNRDRFQVADVNQRHITEPTRLEAIVGVINRDHRVRLPKRWGSGQRAAADGPTGDVYAQNLLSEYHSREGGWGGIGDYHGSDTYIALGSSFMACGVWEAIPILDGLRETRSESRPDPLPADTPGPSETVFGLADLLAIQRMPRLRHWQHLTLYAPTEPRPVAPIEPLRALLHDTVDGTLIETHGPDMLRVAISISQGPVRSSTILGNLGTERRKTKRYVAFRELGRVLRTMLLRRFMNDDELRRTITAATPIAEAWNGLIPWVALGGAAVVRQHNREEQRTIIRDHHLVANLVVCHNVVSMTRVLQALVDEGDLVTAAIIARLSPYKTEPINRVGHYERRFDHVPPPVTEELRLSPARSTREVERG